jgi:hypothetical protein
VEAGAGGSPASTCRKPCACFNVACSSTCAGRTDPVGRMQTGAAPAPLTNEIGVVITAVDGLSTGALSINPW